MSQFIEVDDGHPSAFIRQEPNVRGQSHATESTAADTAAALVPSSDKIGAVLVTKAEGSAPVAGQRKLVASHVTRDLGVSVTAPLLPLLWATSRWYLTPFTSNQPSL